MEQVRITKVFTSNQSKDGKPFVTKAGKPFWKVAIKTDKYGEDWFSSLAFEQDSPEMKLKEGDEKTIIIETDGQFKNFKLPNRSDMLESRVARLEADFRTLMAKLDPTTSAGTKIPDFSEVDEEIDPDAIPF